MAREKAALVMNKLELRKTALEANIEEIPHMEVPRQKVDSTLTEMRELTTEQASLTAAKQDVSKRLEVVGNKAQKLITMVDVAIREHYGNRAEKLVEFDQQPFRSQPRVRVVGEDGKPVKKKKPSAAPAEPSAPPPTE